MDKNRVKGTGKEIEGKIQKTTGKATGNTSQQIKGAAKELEGKVQKAYGEGKDEARKETRD